MRLGGSLLKLVLVLGMLMVMVRMHRLLRMYLGIRRRLEYWRGLR